MLFQENAESILSVLELADLYGMESLFHACTTFLKQRICNTNCVNWLRLTHQLPNCSTLYQACLAYFCRCSVHFSLSKDENDTIRCSHLNEFPHPVVEPFDVDLFISVVSSECLRVDDELHVLELVRLDVVTPFVF